PPPPPAVLVAITFRIFSRVRLALCRQRLACKHIYRLPQELVSNRTVWVVNEENQLYPRTVNVLRSEGEFVLISEGIEQSDKLVLTVPEYPQKGMSVKLSQAKNADAANQG
ncbi:hypothetical protein K6U61_09505, partial [Vibrio vulnificus]|nr:hypothetical protein [Vibrio vulnificus]